MTALFFFLIIRTYKYYININIVKLPKSQDFTLLLLLLDFYLRPMFLILVQCNLYKNNFI
jgi:hypothetical protein